MTADMAPAGADTATRGALAYFLDCEPDEDDFLGDVIAGLSKPQKSLPPKYFYDQVGSQLFDKICETQEYYVTRTELGLLSDIGGAVSSVVGAESNVIEYGSGSSLKIRTLINALKEPTEYLAIDISRQHLIAAAESMAQDYPGLRVGAICADFTKPFDLPDEATQGRGTDLGFFPGSTIGNFEPSAALEFLQAAAKLLSSNGALLIGVDLKKDDDILNAAYNDRTGVTEAFNRNILERIKKELGADLDPHGFEHRAFYNEPAGRIEMHLESRGSQTIRVGERIFSFEAGESIHTESSYKYGIDEFSDMAQAAGFAPERHWTDPDNLFSLHYLTVATM